MVGKNTRGSWHTESWRSSSFGPRNIGTGHKYRGEYSTPSAAKSNAVLDEATAKADASIPERVYARKVTKTPEQLLDEWYSGVHKGTLSPDLLKDIGDKVTIEDFNAWAKSKDLEAPEIALKRLDSDLGRVDSSIKYIFDYSTVAPDHYVDNYGYSDHVYYPLEYGDSPQLASNRTTGTNENFVKNSELTKNNTYTPTEQKPTGWGDRTSSYTFNPLYSYKFIDPNLSPYRQSKDSHTGQVPKSPNAVNTLEPSTIHLNRLLGYEQPKRSGGKLTGLGYAGLTGLALIAPYLKQDNASEQSQTQVPYRMEPEAEVQSEPTLEQQYAAQATPSFSTKINNLFDLYQQQEQLMREKEIAASKAYQDALEMGQRIATGTGYAPELKEENFEFPQELPGENSNINTANLKSPDGGEAPRELGKLSGVKPKVIKDTSNGPVVLNDPNHRTTRNTQSNSATPEQAAASQMVNQYTGIPVEVIRAKNSGYAQPPLNHATDAIWDRVRKAGLSSPEQAIRSGLFTPDEVRYITENDLWRYR